MTGILLLSFLAITGGLVACAGQNVETVKIQFAIQEPVDAMLDDLRFYVHDIELLTDTGQSSALRLSANNKWQNERVALLDLTGAERNDAVLGSVAGGSATFNGIRFTLGVPFDLNHANVLQAAVPLNRGDLFWAWQSGYKFLRLDTRTQDGAHAFHLGSTGCSSASALRPPSQPCAQPNRVQVELRGFSPLEQPIVVNVGELLTALAAAKQPCTGDYATPECAAAFAVTGLDPVTGHCNGVCAKQRLFGAARE